MFGEKKISKFSEVTIFNKESNPKRYNFEANDC